MPKTTLRPALGGSSLNKQETWLISTKNLATGYFASVMATGILSVALLLTGHTQLSQGFWIITAGLYIILIGAYFFRLLLFPKAVWLDLTNAGNAFGYFTFVAATNVLGTRFVLDGGFTVAVSLGFVALVSWVILTYFILMVLLFHNQEPAEKVLNGSWLMATVSCESLAVLGSAVSNHLPHLHSQLMFVSYAFYSLGVILYLITIAFIVNRFFFSTVTIKDLSPSYWINMGATAITTLAGSQLVLYSRESTFLAAIRPFVEGYTVMLWVWGTWWIPFLLLIGVWKHLIKRELWRYEPNLWSIVFPLGMYTVACDTVSKIPGLQLIHVLVPAELWITMSAWSVIGVSFLTTLFKNRRSNKTTWPASHSG